MAEHSIDLKVNVDAREAEELKRLPDEVRQKWEQLNRTLAQGPQMQGPRGQLLQQATGQMQEAAQRATAQGFFTPAQVREFEKNLKIADRLWRDYWREQEQTAKQGSTAVLQQIQGLEQQLQQAHKAGDRTRSAQLSRQIVTLNQQVAAEPQENVARVRQARTTQQQQQRDIAATAALVPSAERVSPERQRQAQEVVAQDFARRQKAYQKTAHIGI